ncbi:MAG: hypothetical protein GKB99_04250 [Methanocellales archaeon]|nr:hypothetical protein [Methanocellales archaeon]
MNIGRREFLKFIAFAGAIATMGFSGCVSTPEPMPNPTPTTTPIPTPKPPASEQTKTQTTKRFSYVGTETKPCPLCNFDMQLQDVYGKLFWICPIDDCGYFEEVTEEEILRKYGYTEQLKSN